MEETALNLLYIGTKSIKKSVKIGKFLPQESTKETKAPATKIYLILRLSINKAKKQRKKTTAPIYAGAATIG